jgi:hypothetical protein
MLGDRRLTDVPGLGGQAYATFVQDGEKQLQAMERQTRLGFWHRYFPIDLINMS